MFVASKEVNLSGKSGMSNTMSHSCPGTIVDSISPRNRMPLTISDDSNDIRDVGPCCGYEDYYAESPMLPMEIGRTDLKRWISTTMIRPEEEEGGRSALRSR